MSNFLLKYTDTYTNFNNKRISDLLLYNCGIEHCNPNWTYGPKRREYHFIHFVREGSGVLNIDGHSFSIHKNQCFIVPKSHTSIYSADRRTPWKYSWIGFLGIHSDQYINYLLNENNFVINIDDSKKYEQKISKIINLPHDSLASIIKINGLTYEILGDLLNEVNKNGIKTDDSISSKAKRYMELNYYDTIKIQDVADFIGVNANYLSDIFKKENGISPKKFLLKLKIKKAKNLLLTTSVPISVVANSVGYNDSLAFSKIFKFYVGMSPSEYRKINKLNN